MTFRLKPEAFSNYSELLLSKFFKKHDIVNKAIVLIIQY